MTEPGSTPAPFADPPEVPVPYRVTRRREETADTVTLALEPVHRALPAFAPGQFAMIYLFGVGEIPISVSGIPERGLVHTVRSVGAVSAALCGLRPGDTAGLRGPFGTGWDLPSARGQDLVVVAGGIGLAPLRPLIQEALAAHVAYGRLHVLIGARERRELLYRQGARHWPQGTAARVRITVDRPSADWDGPVGLVTTLLAGAEYERGRTTAFVCGPEVMIRATARALRHTGLPPSRIRVSLERNMRCATGHCGHCQLGPVLLCRDGPVIGWDAAEPLLAVREL